MAGLLVSLEVVRGQEGDLAESPPRVDHVVEKHVGSTLRGPLSSSTG